MCRKFVVEEIQAFKQGDTVDTSSTQFNSGIVLKNDCFYSTIYFFSTV